MQLRIIKKLVFCLAIMSASLLRAQDNLPLTSKDFATFTTKDTLFKEPYVDVDEWRDKPVRHRYVHGGFKGTETRFSFYFPPKQKYLGRFFQYFTPFPDDENLAQNAKGEDDMISFSGNSGAYFIETNSGGKIDFSKPKSNADPTIAAYRANAASAEFSRVVATPVYGNEKRPYGYGFGGSGGAYRTLGSIENTEGVWDGVVPFVLGSPVAIPNMFTVRMNAMRILHDKLPGIVDALEPGSMVAMDAGLNAEEKEALQEATKMGFPPKAWFAYKTMGVHGFLVLYQSIIGMDSKYFKEDFWHAPGYLGANPPASLLKARIQKVSRIKTGITNDEAVRLGLTEPLSAEEKGTADAAWKSMGEKEGTMPVAFQLEDTLPDVNFIGGDLIIKSGAAAGQVLQLTKTAVDKVILAPTNSRALLAQLKPGDTVQVDNSNFLAVQTYHRHQVPGKEYYVWDQFRDSAGKPIYPQRPMLLGPMFTRGASGVLPKGKFRGKMILVESLWDSEAFPWQADWYRNKLKQNMGDSLDNNFRLWFNDHANHGDLSNPAASTHVVSYMGVLHQALLDLSDWVEKGIAPAATTNYKIVGGQVVVPPTARERKGIQPVVTLKANGGKRAEVKPGQPVSFNATIEVPRQAGKVIAAEWDFEGSGTFPVKGKLKLSDKSGERVTLTAIHTFSKPGTYFVTLKGVSQRQGNAGDPFTRIQNLDRVRVVVK
ncbi:MAG: hypothetical protein M3040_15085 [Bacteroidota bacterium]|nr:hypothetical protein [Bacteroidota bacterium]